ISTFRTLPVHGSCTHCGSLPSFRTGAGPFYFDPPGPPGSFYVDLGAGFTWIGGQPSPGLGGGPPWNMQLIKEEVLSRFILFGENALRHVLNAYIAHYHEERPHQGKGNVILFPSAYTDQKPKGPIQCREQLGGLLKYYHCKAA